MSTYKAPTKDMILALRSLPGFDDLARGRDLDTAMIGTVLEEAARLAENVLAPLNIIGDKTGCKLADGAVKTPPGFREAYAQYRDGGWNGVPFNPDFGGQGLPWAVAFAVQEMWQSANMAFGLCPLLNQAAVEAVESHGTIEQKNTYLAKLISGVWTGTMNLTESHAGTDLGALKTKAAKQADGSYKISGQKIFITYGEHDFAPNIIHMVLARVQGAPEGIKGISLFIVPKFLPDAAGNPGARNDLACTGIEHKLGIHASPTCTMQYGDAGGATGYLIGAENEGIKYMFTMMNNARLSVGLQGVALAERAYQRAVQYASDRVQGTKITEKTGSRVPIIEHADIRRMLLSMRAQAEAGRALAYEAALNLDLARAGDATAQARVDLLTPLVKSWCTDMAVAVASTGIQIHGGMGFIEETGAAQYFRDARILPIYEGTNSIQSMDLVMRKILGDKGAAAGVYFAELLHLLADMRDQKSLDPVAEGLKRAVDVMQDTTAFVLKTAAAGNLDALMAVGVPYQNAFGILAAGAALARTAACVLRDTSQDKDFIAAKILTAQFFATHILPGLQAHSDTVLHGAGSVTGFDKTLFARG